MWLKKFCFLALLGIGISGASLGQTIRSPYSTYGLGNLQSNAASGHKIMGGLGIGGGSAQFINSRNPAWLVRNQFTVFDFGIEGQIRNLSTDSASTQFGSGGLRNAGFVFPIIRQGKIKWTTSVGMQPYSTVNYSNFAENIFNAGAEADTSYFFYRGTGGLNQAHFSNGVAIGKNFTVGLKASYLFGSIIRESTSSFFLGGFDASSNATLYERSAVQDFIFEGGVGYQAKLKENVFLTLGATYQLSANLNTRQFSRLDQRNASDQILSSDTLVNEELTSQYLPERMGFGFSLQKTRSWNFGVDFEMQDWTQYVDPYGENDASLGQQYKLIVGGMITPDFTSSNYLKRMSYGVGGHFEQTPIVVGSEGITDFGINFGLSLPVSRLGSTLNLAVELGSRGTIDNNLLREEYVKLNLGIAYQQLWFIRRKYD